MNFFKKIKENKRNWLFLFILISLLFLYFFAVNSFKDSVLLKGDASLNGFNGERTFEVNNGLLVIDEMDKDLIKEKIEEGKNYLLRMIDKDKNGAHKYYYAIEDSFEERLHTIYTSSLLYTLLNIYEKEEDPFLLEQIIDSGEFILSMQNKEEDKVYGAFSYSYYFPSSGEGESLDKEGREKKFVVGTTSKTIFTLIRLYNLTGDERYLKSAEMGADWLLTMQEEDGSMKPYLRYRDGAWYHGTKESLLYNGQVLSALSKIYILTGKEEYLKGAEKIATRFAQKYEEAGRNFIIGDYRSKNPISNSWVAMSFIDFYKATKNEYYKDIIFEMMDLIIEEQKNNKEDLKDYGQFKGAYSSSGNGWIAEVLCETHSLCNEEMVQDCERYKDSLLKVIRWNMQHTYSEENSFSLGNPERALGGIFWNENKKYVRTDSVCHGLNAYIGILDYLEEGLILSVPNL
jgi:hypothetical protein